MTESFAGRFRFLASALPICALLFLMAVNQGRAAAGSATGMPRAATGSTAPTSSSPLAATTQPLTANPLPQERPHWYEGMWVAAMTAIWGVVVVLLANQARPVLIEALRASRPALRENRVASSEDDNRRITPSARQVAKARSALIALQEAVGEKDPVAAIKAAKRAAHLATHSKLERCRDVLEDFFAMAYGSMLSSQFVALRTIQRRSFVQDGTVRARYAEFITGGGSLDYSSWVSFLERFDFIEEATAESLNSTTFTVTALGAAFMAWCDDTRKSDITLEAEGRGL